MEKLLILLCISSLLACTNSETINKEAVPATVEEHQHAPQKLTLNNGFKWNSDEITNKNVAELKIVLDRFANKQPKLTADFSSVANELQTGLDKMIKECRMQGADHEALHQWLEPLMKNVAQLKNVSDEKEALKLVDEISAQLNNYHQFFE